MRLADVPRVLIDVDGVVGDLMGGFCLYIGERYGHTIDSSMITAYHIVDSPLLKEIHEKIDLNRVLDEFLRIEDVYQLYVEPIDGAVDSIIEIANRTEAAFLTATMPNAPEAFVSKSRWLKALVGNIPVISCPSKQKHWVKADFLVEDRYDTVLAFEAVGGQGLLIKQPWNDFPGRPRLDWYDVVRSIFDR